MDRTINVILKPLRRFAIQKPNASLLLFAATIIAMVLANSPWAHKYHLLLAFPIDLQAGQFNFFAHHGETMSMLAFVNDALMAVFFFVIGLEIKQEVLIGELSSVRKALLPIIAACGGMIVPVLFYMLVCICLCAGYSGWAGTCYSDGYGYRFRLGRIGLVGEAGAVEHAYLLDRLGCGG